MFTHFYLLFTFYFYRLLFTVYLLYTVTYFTFYCLPFTVLPFTSQLSTHQHILLFTSIFIFISHLSSLTVHLYRLLYCINTNILSLSIFTFTVYFHISHQLSKFRVQSLLLTVYCLLLLFTVYRLLSAINTSTHQHILLSHLSSLISHL